MENTTRRLPAKNALRCAFTGYRPAKMPFGYDEQSPLCLDFKKRLRETIEVLVLQGYLHMISGGAQGMDMMAAEAVLDLKAQYPDLTLEIAIPYERQASKWPSEEQARWQRCIDAADMVTVISHEYSKSCFFARNRYMVEQADLLLACFDGKEGGTKMTVEYAHRVGCRVCLIPPVKQAMATSSHQPAQIKHDMPWDDYGDDGGYDDDASLMGLSNFGNEPNLAERISDAGFLTLLGFECFFKGERGREGNPCTITG